MNVKKVVIAKGTYNNEKLSILISFDEAGRSVDIINIDRLLIGRVFEAKVEKVLKDIDACILKLERTNEKGFILNKELVKDKFILSHSLSKPVCQGDSFFVRVSKEKKDKKPYTCSFIGNEEQDDEYSYLDTFFRKYCVGAQFVTDDERILKAFDYFEAYNDVAINLWSLNSFTKEIDSALKRTVYLKNEANIIIDETEALTAVDVNTAKGKKKDFFETNKLALIELARQLRLRNISGIIVVDLLKPMDETQRNELVNCFKNASVSDTNEIEIHGFTRLGLVEITREKTLSPIHENFKNTL